MRERERERERSRSREGGCGPKPRIEGIVQLKKMGGGGQKLRVLQIKKKWVRGEGMNQELRVLYCTIKKKKKKKTWDGGGEGSGGGGGGVGV